VVASAIKDVVMPLTAIAISAEWPGSAFRSKNFEPFRSSADLILRGSGLSVYRANVSRGLVFVVAPRSTVAATGGLVHEFRTAGTGGKDVPIVREPRNIGRYRNRILNVLAMLFPIHALDDPRMLSGGPVGRDFHHAVE
jgi:hypothetical protein